MVSVLKRQAKIGGVLVANTSNSLDELVESYTILITMTGFLEVSSPNLTYGYFLDLALYSLRGEALRSRSLKLSPEF